MGKKQTFLWPCAIAVLIGLPLLTHATDFEVGNLKYSTLSATEVQVTGPTATGDITNLVVPGKVTYSGTTYNVTTIGDEAFKSKASIKTAELQEGVVNVGYKSFQSCDNLTSVKLPNSLRKIGDNGFYYSQKLATINLPQGITYLGGNAISATAITEIVIPGTVTYMGSDVLFNNTKLTKAVFEEGVTSLPLYTFRACAALAEVELPSTLTSIGQQAFYYNNKLTKITCAAVTPPTCTANSFDNVSSSTCQVLVPPQSVDSYKAAAGWKLFTNIFPNVTGTEITAGDLVFYTTSVNSAQVKGIVAGKAPTELNVPAEVKNGDVTYEVTAIGNEAFKGASSLTKVTLPYSIAAIGTDVFSGCTAVATLECGAATPPECAANALAGLNKTACHLVVPSYALEVYKATSPWNGFSNITGGSFFAKNFAVDGLQYQASTDMTALCTGLAKGSALTDITIPAYVDFNGLTYHVTAVGPYAFKAKPITSLNIIGGGVRVTKSSAFENCKSLTTVTIGEGFSETYNDSFNSCSALTSVKLPSTTKALGSNSFNSCSSLTTIELPDSIVTIGAFSFSGCRKLKQVKLSATLAYFGTMCFANDQALKVVLNPNPIPAVLSSSPFTNVNPGQMRLIVPAQSVELYKKAEVWKEFGSIVPDDKDMVGLSIKSVSGIPYFKPNQDITLNLAVYNNEAEAITTFDYTATFNGQQLQGTVTPPSALVADFSKEQTISINLGKVASEGQFDGTVTITQINGMANLADTKTIPFFVVVSNGTVMPKDVTAFSYSDQPLDDRVGLTFGDASLWKAAIRISDPALVGMKIVGMKVRSLDSGTSNSYCWLSDSLTQYPTITAIPTPQVGDSMKVAFVEPYTISPDGVYVGYTMNSTSGHPLPYCQPTGIPGSFYASWDGGSFYDESNNFGCATITVFLEGQIQENSVVILPYNGATLIKTNDAYKLTFTVTNAGKNAVNSLGYTCTVDGVSVNGTAQVNLDASLGSAGKFTVDMAPIAKSGKHSVTMTLNTVNGQPNQGLNKTTTTQLQALTFIPTNRPLMEEGTGTWCGWCTRGWLGMKLMNEKYPEFIGVAWHNQDPMTVTNKIPFSVTGYPGAAINRSLENLDPYFGIGTSKNFGIFDLYSQMAQPLVPADIDVITTWGPDKLTLNVEASARFAAECKNYTLGYILGEDGYCHPGEKPWEQNNSYAGEKYTGYLAELCAMPNPIDGLTFDDVAIEVTAAKGVAQSLPAITEPDKTYNHSHVFDTKSIMDQSESFELIENRDKMWVVAMLIAPDGRVVNSRKVKAGSSATGVGNTLLNVNEEQTIYYDLMGRRVLNPEHGIYVKVQNGKAAKIAL